MTTARNKGFKPLIALSNKDDVLIDFNQRIGEWAYGSLYKGYVKNQNKKVMVKVIDLKKFPLPKSCLDTEVTLLKKLQGNKYIVKFADYRYYENTLTITTDICNKGNLRTYLEKRGALPEMQALQLLLQIFHGLKGLHDIEYSHGALRPENILLHEDDGVITSKLTTFVFARPYSSQPISLSQLPYDSKYLPPEVLKNQKYNSKSDLWALGVLYFEMLYGKIPWAGQDMKELENNIITKKLEFPIDDSISETSINFISRCLDRDPTKRMNWNDVMQHRLIFRGMFSKGNGTYKTLNDEFKEETPLSGKLLYGLRRETPSSSTFRHSKTRSFAKPSSSTLKIRCETTGDLSEIGTSALGRGYGLHTQGNREIDLTMINLVNTSAQSTVSPIKASKLLNRDIVSAGHQPTKSMDANFYQNLVSSVATTDDFFSLKAMNTQKAASRLTQSATKAHTAPFRQMSYKAEMLGELCQLIQENKEFPLYDKMIKVLEEETQKLNKSVAFITDFSLNFKKRIEASANQSAVSNTGSFSLRTPRVSQSIPKKVKSKEIHELLKEILGNLITSGKAGLSLNSESIITIAANLKILREFEEIGEDVWKKMESLKDILKMFNRQKHYDHLKYLLLVKNLV